MKSYAARGVRLARQLRKSWTDAELRLWQALRNRSVEQYKFKRQHPIGSYVVNFVCLGKKVVIEVDGSQHIEQVKYDNNRTAHLEAQGFRVLRFWNNDVLTKTDSVMQVIFDALGGRPSP
jgi:very-short-patch-repair endonuclease